MRTRLLLFALAGPLDPPDLSWHFISDFEREVMA
jgi:hypothetical protein